MSDPGYLEGMNGKDSEGRRSWVDGDVAVRILFGDCGDDATVAAAFARLRPQATYGYGIRYPHPELPDVDSTYVLCTDDRLAVNPDWSRKIAPERLPRANVIELPGSHSPFLQATRIGRTSARPHIAKRRRSARTLRRRGDVWSASDCGLPDQITVGICAAPMISLSFSRPSASSCNT